MSESGSQLQPVSEGSSAPKTQSPKPSSDFFRRPVFLAVAAVVVLGLAGSAWLAAGSSSYKIDESVMGDQDFAAWKEMNQWVSDAVVKKYGTEAPPQEGQQPLGLDFYDRMAERANPSLAFFDRFFSAPPEAGAIATLKEQLPEWVSIKKLQLVGIEKMADSVTASYRVALRVDSPLYALEVAPITDVPADDQGLAASLTYAADLPPGLGYNLDDKILLVNEGESVTFIWKIREVRKTDQGWVFSGPEPALFNRLLESRLSPNESQQFYRIRTEAEIASIDGQQQKAMAELAKRINQQEQADAEAGQERHSGGGVTAFFGQVLGGFAQGLGAGIGSGLFGGGNDYFVPDHAGHYHGHFGRRFAGGHAGHGGPRRH